MVKKRARELALINGRSEENILQTDFDQAWRELTGQEGLAPHRTAAEKLPEDKRWMEVPESEGHKVPAVPAADEQTFAEELVEEGVSDAEEDQMVRATRESLRRDKTGT